MFDWTTWPYDPEDVGRETMATAAENVRIQEKAGRDGIARALGALSTALSAMVHRVDGYDREHRHAENLAKVEATNRQVYEHLLRAIDEIYAATTAVDAVD
jgi:hypothetical protein